MKFSNSDFVKYFILVLLQAAFFGAYYSINNYGGYDEHNQIVIYNKSFNFSLFFLHLIIGYLILLILDKFGIFKRNLK